MRSKFIFSTGPVYCYTNQYLVFDGYAGLILKFSWTISTLLDQV